MRAHEQNTLPQALPAGAILILRHGIFIRPVYIYVSDLAKLVSSGPHERASVRSRRKLGALGRTCLLNLPVK